MPENKSAYFHYAVDPLGRRHAASRKRIPVDMPYGKWDCPAVKHAVTKNSDSWSAEFFFPFSDFNTPVPKDGDKWFCNLLSNSNEFKGSCLTSGNNHNLDMFGIMIFQKKNSP